jgi:hypothetical protein
MRRVSEWRRAAHLCERRVEPPARCGEHVALSKRSSERGRGHDVEVRLERVFIGAQRGLVLLARELLQCFPPTIAPVCHTCVVDVQGLVPRRLALTTGCVLSEGTAQAQRTEQPQQRVQRYTRQSMWMNHVHQQ